MTEENTNLNQEEMLAVEEDVLRGLLDAANDQKDDVTEIEIARKGKVYFRFSIHPLTERKYQDLQDEATKFKKAKNLGGVKVAEDTDITKFRSLLIQHATIKEDREKLWSNKEAWKQLGVINAHGMIDKVLTAGEKKAVVDKIDEISGYGDDADEIIKNSSVQEEK